MPDLETRLPELLRRAAMGAPPDDRFKRRVLRRARGRRVLNATGTGLLGIALVAGAFLGARELALSNGATPADESPSPGPAVTATPLQALWPETTAEDLAAAQEQADAGELSWRLDPVRTAAAFATEILGWDPADVQAEETGLPRTGSAFVTVSNLGLGPGADSSTPAAPQTLVTLQQLGDAGRGGVWSVTRADSDRIDLRELPEAEPAGSRLEVAATFRDVQVEWFVTLGILVLEESGGPSSYTSRDVTGRIVEHLAIPFDAAGTIGVVVMLVDPEGTTVAADIVPITIEAPSSPAPTGPSGAGPEPTGSGGPGQELPEEIPSAMLATRDAIAIAAATRDFDALEALIDPDRFSYNFADGSNPVPVWRNDPGVLDTLGPILQMPFTTTESTPDVGTIYVWPSLVDEDLTNLTPDERAMLEMLGITDADIQTMLDAFGGYVGPRTGIAEDGTWLFFTVGGD